MSKARAAPAPLPRDVYEFSLDGDEAQVYLRAKTLEGESPLSEYIHHEHRHGGLYSLPPLKEPDSPGVPTPQNKKRKRCKVCAPCLRRENCGACSNCENRMVGHQICKLRKCEQLKKKKKSGKWELGQLKDKSKERCSNSDLAAKTVFNVVPVDGPRRGGQMEIRSHDRLEEVALSLDATDGARRSPGEQEGGPEGGGAAPEQQEPARSVTPGQGWATGHGKASGPQQQPPCWGGGERRVSGDHQADMEDAHNLVAFSASVGSLPPSSSSGLQTHTVQLYDKFSQEKDSDGVGGRTPGGAVEGGSQAPEDLSTLQTALSQARHGRKPPNCDCEGPDCPDYLEWLEKKIQLAGRDGNGPCKMADAPHQMHSQKPHNQAHPDKQGHLNNQSHLHNQTQLRPQVNGGNPHQQAPGSLPPALRPGPRPPPIPCSPQVLSIAKEKNVSLQTAIAIEALTQLSATGPHASAPTAQSAHHPHPHNHHGTHLPPSSSRSQSVPPGLQPSHQTWDKHRPQSQGQPPNASPLQPSTSPYPVAGHSPGPHLPAQQWLLQGQEQRNQWAMMASDPQPRFPPPPHGSMDPMSELKQLLGDTSRKFSNASFRSTGPHQHGPNPGLDRVKQEVDLGDYPTSACASMGRYVLPNGQQQYPIPPPLSPGSAAIRFSTQAALQQHLHHKRNLFQGPGLPAQRGAQVGQSLRKWWPQTPGLEGGPLLPPGAIKQEGKEPKRRKSTQASPLVKQGGGGLAGTPVPKPKPIVIKKTKQKASLPTFLPQSQISIQKPSPQILPSPAPSYGPSLGLSHPPQAVPGLPTPAQSQVSIFPPYTPDCCSGRHIRTPSGRPRRPLRPRVCPPRPRLARRAMPPPAPPTTTPQTSIPPSTTSQIPGLSSLDPKFEELIRQFEAEFGDETPASEPCPPLSHPPGQSPPSAQPGASPQSQLGAHANSGPDRPAPPPGAQPAPLPPPAEQEMEVDPKPNQSGSEETRPTIAESPPDEGTLPLAPRQEAQVEQHPVKEEPFTVPLSPFPKRMKIEGSGGVTVLSTTCYSEEDTPTKEEFPCSPSLRGFLESPLRYLDTPTKSLLDTPAKDAQAEFPVCDCVEQILEKDEGPYYNHLGSGPTVASIRELMENRYGEKGSAIRIEKVLYTGREGKSSQGCPIAKWVIRRSGITEKLLCLVRHRAGHHCANAVIVILIMAWEGVPQALGDKLYRELSETLTKYGNPTSRRCGLNDDRTCACQGKDPDTCGASFSFGCSWSMYFNGCKYARSKIPRKFRLQGDRPEQEDKLRDNFQELATEVAPLYKKLAPKAYSNQCQNEHTATDCRLGLKEGRPFSGVTACMDFCAHAHKDQHNLYNGCTVVCTLTKEDNRKVGEIPEDEQLHVLPLYKVALTDEFGSEENQRRKMQTGAIQMLNSFRREVRKLPERAKSCRQRRLEAKAKASEKKKGKIQGGETPGKTDVIRAEVTLTGTPQTPLGNKAIPKQEVKPTIKKEVFIKKEPFNGVLPDGYPAQGPEPYGVYPHPAHPAYYARGGLPPGGQPPAPGPVNGYHPNLPALPYGYFNYPPNALFPPDLISYDGRSGPWPKVGVKAEPLDHKPDVQGLQARLAHPYPSHPEPQHPVHQHIQSRPSSVSSESAHRVTPVIKPEPMDVPVYEGPGPGSSRTATPSSTPQPDAWPAHKPNGGILPSGWDGSGQVIPGPVDPSFGQDRQQPSPYLQPPQWNSYPGPNTPMASPSPSPAMKAAPSPAPSPHPGTPRHWDSPAPSPQPKAWPPPAAYSPALKPGQPAGAFPDKMWSKAGESRSSTPLGVQEKAWRSCGGSAAGSTPSPAPEGRLFPDALQQTEAHACWDANRVESDAESVRGQDDDEVWSDSEHNFLDPNIGGVAVAPAHGSILLECARRELHATTPLKKPNRCHPTRISLVFYQHKNLNQPSHGLALWEAKMKLLAERARERQQEAALLGLSQEEIKAYGKKRKWGMAGAVAGASPGQAKDKKEGPATRSAPSLHTTSTVTSAPYACTQLTGPYSHFV